MNKWLLLFIACFHCSAQAQWYETKGHAYVIQNNTQAARTQAIQNALKKALLVAGASVSSVQQVVNGLLTQDEISIRASGIVNSFELIEETHTDKVINVVIRADIFPEEKKCFSADYRKSLLLTRSYILEREQANIGEIYELESQIMQRLSAKAKDSAHYLDTVLALKSRTNFARLNRSLQAEKIKQLTMSLSEVTNTQFVLYSEIQDVSLDHPHNNPLLFWEDDSHNRQFNLEVYIYNGANGEMLFNKQYHNTALWPWNKRLIIDIASTEFWHSSYGNLIDQTLDTLLTDIDETMMCQNTRGTIVHIENGILTLNLGRKNGVQVGDKFTLLHLNNFVTDSGKSYAGYNVSDFTIEITQVSENTSRAASVDHEILSNIQINDLAVSQ